MMNSIKKIAFISISLFAYSSIYSQIDTAKIATSQKFEEVITFVNKLYVDPVDAKKLTETAIVAMLEQLDPHSTYISKEEVDDAKSSINGSFVGIGIRFQILKDTLMVVATIPGGPSEKLGILAGDKILKIEGNSVAGVGLKNSQVREKFLGELGTKVRIEVKRKNNKQNLDFVITRDHIPMNSIDAAYMINPEIGYIKLNSFSRTTMEELDRSLRDLKSKGMKHLIFDLQGNGGGLLYAAQKVADQFLAGRKLIVYSEGKAQPKSELFSGDKGLFETGNLIVLTDEYSASASEIVSGALQDWDRALIVGRRTFGKGLVQRPIDLTDGSEIRLTIARYFTPTGRFIQKPYDDKESYRKDLTQRYLNGEFSHADSIKLPDSLKFETKINKRTVYGGGGIMPDVFVPLDTTEITDYYRNISRKGHINAFTLEYTDKNREKLHQQYPSFETFNATFKADDAFMQSFIDYVKKEDTSIVYNESEYQTSKKLLALRLKAVLAQDLWGYNEFYQIYNESNEIINRAVELITTDELKKYNINTEETK